MSTRLVDRIKVEDLVVEFERASRLWRAGRRRGVGISTVSCTTLAQHQRAMDALLGTLLDRGEVRVAGSLVQAHSEKWIADIARDRP